ncbi:MAG: ATP-dependent Clp protease ATP-binding subunit ClpA [Oligoflexia bacterium]|nr:MAG: ATP-dependent Clp protease ATP-binding subunit ClpA [Oligoflexia bacterium]
MMTKNLERKLAEAAEMAKVQKSEFVTLEHILLALTESPPAVEVLTGAGCNVQSLKKDLRDYIKKHCQQITPEQLGSYGGFEQWQPEFTLACHRLLQRAAMQVRSAGKDKITEGHLLVSFFYEQDSHAVYAMTKQGVSQFDLINYVSHGVEKDGEDLGFGDASPPAVPPQTDIDGLPVDESKKDEGKNSPLESFCVNLNEKAKDGKVDPLIGRIDILDRTMQVLCRRTKNNPLLIGEPGVGKTAIAEGLAARIVKGEVPEILKDKIIYSLDMGTLLAGTKFRGDFEGRIKGVMKDVKKRKNVILFIDEIHTIVGAGSTSGGSMDASNLLKPALASGEISCIGSTTHNEYRQQFEKDRALNRRFQKIDIKEPTPGEALDILKGLKTKFEDHHQVKFTDEALKSAVDLSVKYMHNKLLPDKAIDVLDEAGAHARLKGRLGTTITDKDIEEIVASIAQVPVASVSLNDREQLKNLDGRLKASIFGQDEAIDKLVASIKYARTGLGRENKPIGSYLFTGPTGVGKTEVCKQLAEIMGIPLVRFDMSEYMEKHTVARLVGAPPGYVGYEEGGQLTEAVTKSPYCVLLLDEIEKAHSDIYNILLQVMDAGRLTDANGRTADFRNVVLVMTSNAGAQDVAKGNIGLVQHSTKHSSMEAIKKVFTPEFLNRLDSIVSFKDLDESIVLRIVSKFIEEVQMQLQKKGVELVVSQEVKEWLLKKGYDKVYGARPLHRTIDEHIKKSLVDELLFGRLSQGGRVEVQLKDNALHFEFMPRP